MQIGIVGKPSCGKSTFFKAATSVDVAIASYPFTTIKPNFGIGYVRVECAEKLFNVKCNPRVGICEDGIRFVPVELIDVAGLVPGAHEGKGLGNQFLNDLNQADALIHIVDASGSTNEKGEAVPPLSYDPINDVKFLEYEIDMWYLDVLKRGWEKFARKVQTSNQEIEDALAKQLCTFKVTSKMVEDSINKFGLNRERPAEWADDQLKELAIDLRKKTKPILIACNKIDIPGAEKNLERLKKEFPDYIFIPCSGDYEIALKAAAKHGLIKYLPGSSDFKILQPEKLSEQQKAALENIRENVLKKFGSTGVQDALEAAVFKLLKYIAVFPGGIKKLADKDGNILPDCFLLPPDSTALDFAYKIHSDIAKNMLYAMDVKTKMKIGKDHKLKHGDVIEIISAAK